MTTEQQIRPQLYCYQYYQVIHMLGICLSSKQLKKEGCEEEGSVWKTATPHTANINNPTMQQWLFLVSPFRQPWNKKSGLNKGNQQMPISFLIQSSPLFTWLIWCWATESLVCIWMTWLWLTRHTLSTPLVISAGPWGLPLPVTSSTSNTRQLWFA